MLFSLMAKGELVSKDASALMVSILKRQQVNNRFPRYLGADVEIAHKTGDGQPWVANDAGILWVKGTPIVLVVFAGHHRGTTEEIHDAEGRIAAIVADYFGGKVDASALRPAARPDRRMLARRGSRHEIPQARGSSPQSSRLAAGTSIGLDARRAFHHGLLGIQRPTLRQ